uniref:Uncharacterized protein n=1 Tax=Rhipicephalus pulchellus TaxID=72859 RepID=L7LWL2_RHIPC
MCPSIHPSLCLLFIHLSVSLSMHLSIYPYIYTSTRLYIRPSIRLSIHLPVHLDIHISDNPSVPLSVYPHACLPLNPSVYPSTLQAVHFITYRCITSQKHTLRLVELHKFCSNTNDRHPKLSETIRHCSNVVD